MLFRSVWTSSNETVATVKDGKVTAIKAGTAIITVSTLHGVSATCKVTVNENPSHASITLDKTELTLVETGVRSSFPVSTNVRK